MTVTSLMYYACKKEYISPIEDCIDPSKICSTCGCYDVYAPVCGCNGITYGNDCEAMKEGVKYWFNGPCKEDINTACIDTSKICPTCFVATVHDPVCGCDGKTYENSGWAAIAGVKSWSNGPCKEDIDTTTCIDSSKICPTCACFSVFIPVCGCNGTTYGNDCEAMREGVKSWNNGHCKEDTDTTCIDSSKICSPCGCMAVYAPVCGCNGITYGNDCEAKKEGVKSWINGPC